MTEPNWVALGQSAVAIDYIGAWAAGTPYKVGDVVVYQGVQYLAVNPSTGQTPPAAMAATPARLGTLATQITDWNTALDNGWYGSVGGANVPAAGVWYVGIVSQSHAGSSYVRQTVYDLNSDRVWTRRRDGGTWQPWVLTGVPGVGLALPASPVDGDEYTLVDSLTVPTYQWRFKYVASITDAYKWVYVGGVGRGVEQLGLTATSTSFIDIPGAVITVPRAGIWSVEFGADVYGSAAGQYIQIAPKFGAAAANLVDSAGIPTLTAAGNSMTVMRWLTKTVAASTAIQLQQVTNGGTGYSRYVWLKITPVRVS